MMRPVTAPPPTAPDRRPAALQRGAEALVAASTGRRALLGIAVFVVFSATVLPWQAGIAAGYSEGVGSPDSSLWYSAHRLYELAEAYGPDGRAAYVRARVTFDVVWPVVYAAMLVLAAGWLLRLATRPLSRLRLTVLLPVAALVADYAENTCTALVMARYPAATDLLAALAPFFTLAKWLLLGASFVLLPVLGVLAWRRTR
jgi:hypothetical protein